ncbi:MAG TPA: hypothetical protein PLU27_07860, partial [Ginsengibacter sp.]|nr:hypothetical protein [Ginsengibacter sp.]
PQRKLLLKKLLRKLLLRRLLLRKNKNVIFLQIEFKVPHSRDFLFLCYRCNSVSVGVPADVTPDIIISDLFGKVGLKLAVISF